MRKRTILLSIVWMLASYMYYCIAFVSVKRPGNIFWNFFLLGATEIPSYLLVGYAYKYFGRKIPIVFCLFMTGLTCGILAVLEALSISEIYPISTVVVATTAKFFLNSPYHVVWVWGSEIFPTVVRNFAVTLTSTLTMILNSTAPHFVELVRIRCSKTGNWNNCRNSQGNRVWPPLPTVLIAVVGFVAGTCALFLPETKGQDLPDTVRDIEDRATIAVKAVTQLELLSKEALAEDAEKC